MTESFMDKVLRWCRTQKLNLDPSVEMDLNGVEMFLCRLRPWKQKKGNEVMVLASAGTFEDAVRQCVLLYKAGEDLRLDWSVRPWDGDGRLGRSTGADEDLPF